jgi:hypothetical protein
MDVLGFLCVSIGSSTVQLHDSLGSRRTCACSEAGFSSQHGDRVWGLYYRRATFCYIRFYGQNDSMQRIFIKWYFLFMVRSVCRVKRFAVGSRNSLKDLRKSQMIRPGAELAETTVKRLLCCGFRRTGKAMGQVNRCCLRICREINVLSMFRYHMLYHLCEAIENSQSQIIKKRK